MKLRRSKDHKGLPTVIVEGQSSGGEEELEPQLPVGVQLPDGVDEDSGSSPIRGLVEVGRDPRFLWGYAFVREPFDLVKKRVFTQNFATLISSNDSPDLTTVNIRDCEFINDTGWTFWTIRLYNVAHSTISNCYFYRPGHHSPTTHDGHVPGKFEGHSIYLNVMRDVLLHHITTYRSLGQCIQLVHRDSETRVEGGPSGLIWIDDVLAYNCGENEERASFPISVFQPGGMDVWITDTEVVTDETHPTWIKSGREHQSRGALLVGENVPNRRTPKLRVRDFRAYLRNSDRGVAKLQMVDDVDWLGGYVENVGNGAPTIDVWHDCLRGRIKCEGAEIRRVNASGQATTVAHGEYEWDDR